MSSPLQLYFTRHGESECNRLHVFSNRGWKHPLTATGLAQASALADELAGQPVHAIYTSPLMRAVQTAQVLSERLKVDYQTADALCEYDTGRWEGSDDPAGWQEYHQVRAAWRRGEFSAAMQGGESLLDLQARFVPFIDQLRSMYRSTGGMLVLVSHGGVYGNMLPRLLENVSQDAADRYPIPHTGMIIAEDTPSGLVCRSWCGMPVWHLDDAGPVV